MIKRKIKTIQFSFQICPIFYTQKRLSDLFTRSNLPTNQLTLENNTNMNIIPNCSLCNNDRCICHQRNLIYSLQHNICLKASKNSIRLIDTKQGKYIGETSRHLIKRLSEHLNAIKRNNVNSSAMTAHYTDVHSNIKIEDKTFTVNLSHKCTGFIDRKILEAYYIINYKPTLNKNTGLYLTMLHTSLSTVSLCLLINVIITFNKHFESLTFYLYT